MADNSLKFVIEAVDKTQGAFDSAEKNASGFSSKIESMQPAFKAMAAAGTVAFTAIAGEIGVAVHAFAESQAQLSIVDGILDNLSKSTLKQFAGGTAQAKEEARKFGSQLQALGGIGDETAAEGFARLLQQTGKLNDANRLAGLAADIATAKHMDYASAVTLVSKVAAGNTGALSKMGIAIDKDATSTEALGMLTERFGGQYQKFGQTVEGQTLIMKQSFGDLQENIGQAFLPILQQVLDAVKPIIDAMVKWTSEHPQLTKNILLVGLAVSALVAGLGFLGLVIPLITAGVTTMGLVFSVLFSPITVVTLAILALIAAGIYLYKNWDTLRENLVVIWNAIKDGVGAAVDWLLAKLQPLIDAFNSVINLAAKVGSTVGNVAGKIGGAIGSVFGRALGGPVDPNRPYLVGENGPELFTPSSFGSIGGASGGALVVNITGNSFMGREGIAEQIGNDILRVLKRNVKI